MVPVSRDSDVSTIPTFLDLPRELREQVYDLAVPVSRLTPFPLGDPEWSMKTQESRGVPELLFTSRKIYEEVVPMFYSRAILEVAPAQQSYSFWDFAIDGKMISHAYGRLLHTFRIYSPKHLRYIRRAHVFSNQTQAIDGQCYEALLMWLVEQTSVENIQLSTRPMTRISGKASFDLPSWRAAFVDATPAVSSKMRLIRVWSNKGRPPWEYEKMMRLRCKAFDGSLNSIQVYFYMSDKFGKTSDLQLDPRWLIKLNEEPEKVAAMEAAGPIIDRIMSDVLQGKEAQDYKDNSRHFRGDIWVYQMILVSV